MSEISDDFDDELWATIGDPTRLRVLDLLIVGGPATASGLGRQVPVTRQAVAKHLAVLERSGLVRAQTVGREVRYAVDPKQFSRACAQVAGVNRAWGLRLRRIKTIAETVQRSREEHPGREAEQ